MVILKMCPTCVCRQLLLTLSSIGTKLQNLYNVPLKRDIAVEMLDMVYAMTFSYRLFKYIKYFK